VGKNLFCLRVQGDVDLRFRGLIPGCVIPSSPDNPIRTNPSPCVGWRYEPSHGDQTYPQVIRRKMENRIRSTIGKRQHQTRGIHNESRVLFPFHMDVTPSPPRARTCWVYRHYLMDQGRESIQRAPPKGYFAKATVMPSNSSITFK
jgi:hypothetical protein